jgi:NADH-quinone oxidoreductase subunit F
MRDLLERIEHGEGKEEYIPQLRIMSQHLWNAYCALAPGATCPVESLLTFFEEEVREHIRQRKCPFE